MYTRVLTFTGATDIEGGVGFVRDTVVPILNEQTGYRGVTASVDRSAGVLGILSIWETEADRDASESALAKTRQEASELVGGDLTVETFEQLVVETSQPPVVGSGSALMVTRTSMDPAKIDENIEFFKGEVVPRIKANPGFRALRNMINRQTGQGIVGTVWADRQAMEAAADDALARRAAGVARGVTFIETRFREVVFADLK